MRFELTIDYNLIWNKITFSIMDMIKENFFWLKIFMAFKKILWYEELFLHMAQLCCTCSLCSVWYNLITKRSGNYQTPTEKVLLFCKLKRFNAWKYHRFSWGSYNWGTFLIEFRAIREVRAINSIDLISTESLTYIAILQISEFRKQLENIPIRHPFFLAQAFERFAQLRKKAVFILISQKFKPKIENFISTLFFKENSSSRFSFQKKGAKKAHTNLRQQVNNAYCFHKSSQKYPSLIAASNNHKNRL